MADSATDIFSEHRAFLSSLAYRMLGSAADAEDLVQETYLRWRRATAEEIHSPRAYLTTILTRLCITHLESARVRREEYVGPWLPEPLITARSSDPVELSESLTMAFLVLLESLNPVERAVFLLHEVFGYSHAEAAEITGKSEETCRQILSRAKKAVAERRPRFSPQPGAAERLVEQFGRAAYLGDLDGLMALLKDDVTLYADGGGVTPSALNPIYGKDRVARFLIGATRKGGSTLHHQVIEINAQPGFIGFRDGRAQAVVILDTEDDRIRAVYIVVNPEKLDHLPKEQEI